jgi:hypothetical protein
MVELTPDEQPTSDVPRFIWPACGAVCDIFWWAQRKAESVHSPAAAAESATKES